MSEPTSKQIVLAVWPEAICMHSATGDKSIWSTNDFNTCEPLSTEIPEAVIRFFPSEDQAWDDAASKLAAKSPEGAAMQARLIHDRDKDRVEKIAGLLEEIATLRAELARVREQWADTEIARWTAVQDLSRERERHQWIDVNQELPADRKAVLVWCPERMNKYTACWVGDTWHHFGGVSNWHFIEEITHWMPTPEPPALLEPKVAPQPAPVDTGGK